MAFEDSAPQSGTGSRYLGEGFRQEPDFREGMTTPVPPAQLGASITDEDQPTMVAQRPAPNLEFVFDDPADGEPGRDHILVHGIWELLLVVAVIGTGYLLHRADTSAFGGDGMRRLLLTTAVLGLLALGSALALRAAVPNLAVGAVAGAAALHFGQNSNGGLVTPVLAVLGLCVVIGLIQGVIVAGLHVPSWAVSIGVGLVLVAWAGRQDSAVIVAGYDPLPHVYLWFGGFVAASVLAGLVGLIPGVRRALGRFRPIADPAQRRGVVGAVIVISATTVSTMLAGLAGVLVISLDSNAAPLDAPVLSALAIGAALLGGTSAYGRRGGIFGTVFAVGLLILVMAYADATNRSWQPAVVAAVAILVGLAVTRLVERFGRPSVAGMAEEDEDWVPRVHSSPPSSGWSATPKPASSTASSSPPGGLWGSDEAWGSTSDGR